MKLHKGLVISIELHSIIIAIIYKDVVPQKKCLYLFLDVPHNQAEVVPKKEKHIYFLMHHTTNMSIH